MSPTTKRLRANSRDLSPTASSCSGMTRRGSEAGVSRPPVLRPRPRARGRDAQRRVHRAGADRPRPGASTGRPHARDVPRARRADRRVPLRRVPARPAPGEQPAQPRHHRDGPPGHRRPGPEPRRPARAGGGARPRQRRPRPAGVVLPGFARDARGAGGRLRHPLRVRHLRPGDQGRLAGGDHRQVAALRQPVGDRPAGDCVRREVRRPHRAVDRRTKAGTACAGFPRRW